MARVVPSNASAHPPGPGLLVGITNSCTVPSVQMRPSFPAASSVNQTPPSAPLQMPPGEDAGVTGYSVICAQAELVKARKTMRKQKRCVMTAFPLYSLAQDKPSDCRARVIFL